jgi:hypothetical protein
MSKLIPVIVSSMLFTVFCPVFAQQVKSYRGIHFSSAHTSFPDTGRINGHTEDSIFYPRTGHYDDNTVLLIIPDNFKPEKKIELIVWFHGWHNNIDTAVRFYDLAKQFVASGRNAILVLPEAAKNAADSYGGKLQQKGMFRSLLTDILHELTSKKIAPDNAYVDRVVLAGHSGGYQVIADILKNGDVPINEVFLFDALYARLETFGNWIAQDTNHHYVNWYTNYGGGTDEMSDSLMNRLKTNNVSFKLLEESDLKPEVISNNRILFVHSTREHNVIINNPDNLELLLRNRFFRTNK